MKVPFSRRVKALAGCASCFVCLWLGVCLESPTQERGDPVVFRPDPSGKGQGVSLPRGEVLLFQVLQALADVTAQPVCFAGNDPPQTTIVLPRATEQLELKEAKEILEKNGFEISSETYKGKPVHWVARPLVPPKRKGKIVRPGEQEPLVTSGKSTEPAEAAGPSAKLSFYERQGGAGGRFLVLFQTDSRKEAEEVLSVLEARERAKARSQR